MYPLVLEYGQAVERVGLGGSPQLTSLWVSEESKVLVSGGKVSAVPLLCTA